jgi:TrmH family RNA methyltransferase
MSEELIVSATNPYIKSLVRLRDRRERDQTGLFVIEGFREIRRALEGPVEIVDIFTCPELYLGGNEVALVAAAAIQGARVRPVAEGPFRKASYRDRPEGLLAVARQFSTALDDIQVDSASLLLVVEAIEKPGNLGTMLRTAEAAGVAGVIVCDPATDPFNPNVVRSSLGTLFSVPLGVGTTSETIAWLRGRGLRTVATTPSATLPHWRADLTGPLALVIGSEQYGLSGEWLASADERVVIPMPGSVDSLNAAVAAAVVLFEASRQRTLQSE